MHEKKADTVAIVGMSPTRDQAPFEKKDVEIWGMNDLYNYVPRVDVLFQLHDKIKIEEYARDPKHMEWLKVATIPIYMIEKLKEVPSSIEYPIQKIKMEFGSYFTNGVSYLIALAIWLQYENIQIYGVDMSNESEFNYQKPSVTYFIGLARGRGIKVWVPKDCMLFRTKGLYAFEVEDNWGRTLHEKHLRYYKEFKKTEEKEKEAIYNKGFLAGKVAAAKEMMDI